MLPHPDDLIVAQASAPGGAARSIVRVSGVRLRDLLSSLFAELILPFRHGTRIPTELPLPGWRRPCPVDLHVWPTNRSYTGQPLAELHVPGSPPVIEAVIARLCGAGARLAQPGEFTLRAFLAGRLDLAQAEAVLGVIDARSLSELQAALDQLAGGLSGRIGKLRSGLLDLLADLEAGLDFAHEAIEFVSHSELVARLQQARDEAAELLSHADGRTRPGRLPHVVLAGPPNAGKSTLFNALTGRELALVSAERGTTRDFLAAEVTWSGQPLVLIDTAGEDATVDAIAEQAQSHRKAQVAGADVVVWCLPASEWEVRPVRPLATNEFAVATKGDEGGSSAPADITVSALTGQGLESLKKRVVAALHSETCGPGDWLGSTAARSRDALARAAESLDRTIQIAEAECDQALLAVEIRDALDDLGTIVGAVYTDDVLDSVFSRFCIGK